MKLRSIVLAIGLSLVPMAAPAVSAVAAGGQVPVTVPAFTQVKHFTLPCADQATSHVKTCTGIMTVHVNGHTEFRIPGAANSALACYGKTYKTGWVAWQQNGGFGNELWYARIDVEDWFTGCSAGNVYISYRCQAYEGWTCVTPPPQGAFWDPGKGANTDWDNQETKYYCPFLCGDYLTDLRFWTYPDGHSTWWSQSYCQMC